MRTILSSLSGRLHAVASDSNSPATTYTCAAQLSSWEETNYCRSHSSSGGFRGSGKEVIKSIIFNELSVLPAGEKRIGFLLYNTHFATYPPHFTMVKFKMPIVLKCKATLKDVLIKDVLVISIIIIAENHA